jgi:hypothetical protein
MMLDTWGNVLEASFQDLWRGVVNFVPTLIMAILILLVGWILGTVVGKAVAQVVRSLKVDNAFKDTALEDGLKRAGFTLDIGAFIGGLIRWFFIIVFLVAAFDVLGLEQINQFLQQVVLLYLPQVLVAVIILLVAVVLGDVMDRIVTGSARAAEVKHAQLLGNITRWAIWIFAALAALYHLGVAGPFLQTLFTGVVVAISLALGLSFGLGGQQAASQFIEKVRDDMKR